MNIKNKRRVKTTLIIILAVLAILISNPKKTGILWLDGITDKFQINLGLDLQGGIHLLYEADMSNIKSENKKEALEGIQDVVKNRVDPNGVGEVLVQTSQIGDTYRLIVDIPGKESAEEAKKLIEETPLLEFKEQDFKAVLTDEERQFIQSQKETQMKKANEILQKALTGEDFATLVKENSEDSSSSEEDGDLGFFKKGDMVDKFSEAAFSENLNKGEVYPEIVETEFGFHIIKKDDEKEEDGEKQVKASHILLLVLSEESLLSQKQQSFRDTGLTGQQLKESQLRFNQQTNESEVGLVFDDEGKDLFKEITERNQGKPVAIYLDGIIISAPIVQSVIRNGEAVISGNFNIQEAKELVQRLNAGALPVPINLVSQQSIGPTLGKISLEKSLKAGLIGLTTVSVFMILYYRIFGLISVVSLLLYTVLMVSIFKLSSATPFSITLTLSGIAGYILSVGMAVDANILIFERIKEEIRSGKSLRVSADEGFKRAWPSIRDGNISTIITALILIALGTGFIKGFALTLMIGIMISMFTAIVVTQMILKFILIEKFENHKFLFIAKSKLKNKK